MAKYLHNLFGPVPSNAIGVQVLFHWTRSEIGGQLDLMLADGAILTAAPVTNDGLLVTARWPAGTDFLTPLSSDSPIATLSMAYSGEPLRPRKQLWLTPKRGTSDEPVKVIYESAEFKKWIACRKAAAKDNDAREFFLLLDMESHHEIVKRRDGWETPDFRTARLKTVKLAGGELLDRFKFRASGGDPTDLPSGIRKKLVQISAFMTPLLQHLGSTKEIGDACDQFAAGHLLHYCDTTESDLWQVESCDADSANIVLFAELALAMEYVKEMSADDKAFWKTLVNPFARMQELYFARWDPVPRRFDKYVPPAPALKVLPPEIIDWYKKAGDDIKRLKERIVETLSKHIIP